MSDARRSVRRASAAIAVAALAMSCAAGTARLSAQTTSTRSDLAKLHEVVAAERAFSKLSIDRGMKHAFLTNLSDSGVIFRPTAINAKQSWSARENPKATLSWEPERAEICFSGDLAMSMGPWKLTFPPDRKQPAAFGRFLSMWRKQADGSWKVVADIGISHEQPYRTVGSTGFSPGYLYPPPGPTKDRATLASLDRDLGNSSMQGVGRIYRQRTTDDFRLMREGYFIDERPVDAYAALDSLAGRFEYVAQGSGVSKAEDLGYSYGLATRFAPGSSTPADTTVYFHVWRRLRGGWRVAVAMLNPLK